MVSRFVRAMAAGLVISICPMPCLAQDFLEKMQADVAAVVKKVRGAVVSIEDDRPYKQVGRIDVDAAVAEALKDAEKSLERETRRERSGGNRTGSPEDVTRTKESAKRIAGIQEQVKILHEKMQENLPRSVRMMMMAAPKAGTGFCIGDSYVVTTADVLQGMRIPIVITDQGSRIKATIINCDTDLNVGLLKLPPEAKLDCLKWGDSTTVFPGHFAISIGNQSGQMNSISLSMVSGIRTEGTFAGNHFYPSLIHINGTVGAGSSGAPLINPRGELIGMVAGVPAGEWSQTRIEEMVRGFMPDGLPGTPGPSGARINVRASDKDMPALLRDHGDEQGQFSFIRPPVTSAGFALPVNYIREAVEKLKDGKKVVRGWIGIRPMDFKSASPQGPITGFERSVVVNFVWDNSPACKAGIKVNDVLISINGKKLMEANEVREISSTLKPGDKMSVVIKRGGEQKTLNLAIEARPEEVDEPKAKPKKTSHWGGLPGVLPVPPAAPTVNVIIPPCEVEADSKEPPIV